LLLPRRHRVERAVTNPEGSSAGIRGPDEGGERSRGRAFVGGGAVVDQTSAGGEKSPPAPDVLPRVFRAQKGDQLDVGAVPERDEDVARQPVGVLAAGGDRVTEHLVFADGLFQVAHEDHRVIQTVQHTISAEELGEKRSEDRAGR